MRLTLKIALALSIAFALVLVGRQYLWLEDTLDALERDAREDQEAFASTLAPVVARTWRARGGQAARKQLAYAHRYETHRRMRLVHLRQGAARRAEPAVALQDISGLSEERPVISRARAREGGTVLYTYALLSLTGPDNTPLAIEIVRNLPDRATLMKRNWRRIFPEFAAFVALSILLSLVIGGWLVGQPLERLVTQMERIGSGDLDARVQATQRDELGVLARAMNRMAARLQDAQRTAKAEHEGRMAAVDQLRHSDRLATVGKLAAAVTHELGTPLNVVRGRASLIASSTPKDSDTHANAEIIVQQVDRMTQTIRRLLDFARGRRDGGHDPTQPERNDVDVRELVDSTVELLQTTARKKRVSLEARARDNTPSVSGNFMHLEQVLTNLVTNAIDASPQGSTVVVGTGPTDETPPQVQLWVEDQGPGIDEEHLPRLFTPFFTTKETGQGTGLGLAIAQGIVTQHGGQIQVHTEPGQGTRFTVTLPSA